MPPAAITGISLTASLASSTIPSRGLGLTRSSLLNPRCPPARGPSTTKASGLLLNFLDQCLDMCAAALAEETIGINFVSLLLYRRVFHKKSLYCLLLYNIQVYKINANIIALSLLVTVVLIVAFPIIPETEASASSCNSSEPLSSKLALRESPSSRCLPSRESELRLQEE